MLRTGVDKCDKLSKYPSALSMLHTCWVIVAELVTHVNPSTQQHNPPSVNWVGVSYCEVADHCNNHSPSTDGCMQEYTGNIWNSVVTYFVQMRAPCGLEILHVCHNKIVKIVSSNAYAAVQSCKLCADVSRAQKRHPKRQHGTVSFLVADSQLL